MRYSRIHMQPNYEGNAKLNCVELARVYIECLRNQLESLGSYAVMKQYDVYCAISSRMSREVLNPVVYAT